MPLYTIVIGNNFRISLIFRHE